MGVRLDGSLVHDDMLSVEITGDWFGGVDLTTISPAPAAERLVPGGVVLEFDVERAGDLEVVMNFRAKDLGRLGLGATSGGSTLTVSQFVLP